MNGNARRAMTALALSVAGLGLVATGASGNTVKDGASKPTAGVGCTGATVTCQLSKLTSISVGLGNEDDTLDASAVSVRLDVDAGSGADKDTFAGHGGSDDIEAKDALGGESVDCGSSAFDDHFAHVDASDVVSNDCDRVKH